MKSEMGAKKRRSLLRVRKALSDSTNLTTTNAAATATRPILKPNLSNPSTNSHDANNFHNVNDNNNNQSSISMPSRGQVNASFAHCTGDCEVSEPCSVYGRRNTADNQKIKAKSIAVPSSCPPAVKTQNIRNKINKDGEKRQSKACPVPKQCRVGVSNHDLPHDFIKQQREYFAEIDAFKLEEEEVESGEQLE